MHICGVGCSIVEADALEHNIVVCLKCYSIRTRRTGNTSSPEWRVEASLCEIDCGGASPLILLYLDVSKNSKQDSGQPYIRGARLSLHLLLASLNFEHF